MLKQKIEPEMIKGSKLKHFIALSLFLFAFWLLLSGKFTPKFLIIGSLTAVFSAWITMPLLLLPSEDRKEYFWAFDFPYFQYAVYWLWLLKEIIKANIDIAMIVLNPKLPINPQMFEFKKEMSNPLAHVTLANSITLTPGTITVDVEDDTYVIHALTDDTKEGLAPENGEGEMLTKVARLFNE